MQYLKLVKVWIFKGEVLGGLAALEAQKAAEKADAPAKPKRNKTRGKK